MSRSHRRAVLSTAGTAVLLLAMAGCMRGNSYDRAEAERYIRAAEQQWAESVANGDTAIVERIVADDFLGIDPAGGTYDKASMMRHAKDATKEFVSNHLDDMTVRFFAGGAVARGTESWERRRGEPRRGRFVWTDTWLFRDGAWQIVAAEDVLASSSGMRPTDGSAAAPDAETLVRRTVQAFYAAFNAHGFDRAAEFATDDWNHINPLGGRTRGRAAVLNELREVHRTFLKNVSDTIERMDVRFASPEVAIATVTSRVSAFTLPNGAKHDNEEQVRTFVVVERGGTWRIMQDQNTIVQPQP